VLEQRTRGGFRESYELYRLTNLLSLALFHPFHRLSHLSDAAPKEFPARNPKKQGVGRHPHRGFETVTIAFQGEIEHADNKGNRGVSSGCCPSQFAPC